MVADIAGYSRLVGVDEAGTIAVVRSRWETALKPLVSENGGSIVKLMGDGALAEFPSAVGAVCAALALQKRMDEINAEQAAAPAIRLRIGINLGDVIAQDDDIFGDDVNIAARLEALSRPGEIYISQSVHDAVCGKIRFAEEDIGDVELKNITRKIRAFRIYGSAAAEIAIDHEALTSSRLSVAVLPFDNMSGVPEHDYIGEGLAENILTDLARFRDLMVIARNSSFVYKGKPTRIQDIRRDLGVSFILEGSVQKEGERIRVSAQLIDGASGKHVWSERYDRRSDDLFALMDEIAELIVATLATTYGGRLRKAATAETTRAGPTTFEALDNFVKGMEELNKCTRQSIRRAREFFHEALKSDPCYAKALAKTCWSHIYDLAFGWSDDEAASWALAREAALASLAADDSEAWSHWAAAGCDVYTGHQGRAIASMRRAVELNPNDADVLADLGLFLAYVGDAEEAISYALKANRLNPNHPEYYEDQLGQIYFAARRYEDAIRTLEGVRSPTVSTLAYLAASEAAAGYIEEARSTVMELLTREPNSKVSIWTSAAAAPYTRPEDVDHLARSLCRAGLPE